jgi:hypothetical protein
MKNFRISRLLFMTMLLALTSCHAFDDSTVVVENRYSMTLPFQLSKKTDLNDDASLQYGNGASELYVVVIDDTKEEFREALQKNDLTDRFSNDLEGFTDLILTGFEESASLKNIKQKDAVINGMKAKILSATGTSDGHGIYWQIAYVEGKAHYYQILTWTLSEREQRHTEAMSAIINSFREL